MSKVNPDSTGLNPAWRKAIAQLGYSVEWADGTSIAGITQLRKINAQNLKRISNLTPGSGAYFNEVSYIEFNLPIHEQCKCSILKPSPLFFFVRDRCSSLTRATRSLVRITKN